MRAIHGLWVMVLFVTAASSARAGDIYTCKGTHGEKVYQNAPCPTTTNQVEHRTYSPEMARAVDGSSGATERIYQTSQQNSYSGKAGAPEPRDERYSYGAGTAPTAVTTPARSGGIGSSAYQRGEVQGTRCVDARSRVYYTAGQCGTSTTYAGTQPVDWHKDQVQGVPGAVMVSPNEALNPMTGQIVQLQAAPTVVPVYRRTNDVGTTVDVDEACAGARAAAAGRFSKKADARVQELCRFGRSMYDQQRSGAIP